MNLPSRLYVNNLFMWNSSDCRLRLLELGRLPLLLLMNNRKKPVEIVPAFGLLSEDQSERFARALAVSIRPLDCTDQWSHTQAFTMRVPSRVVSKCRSHLQWGLWVCCTDNIFVYGHKHPEHITPIRTLLLSDKCEHPRTFHRTHIGASATN